MFYYMYAISIQCAMTEERFDMELCLLRTTFLYTELLLMRYHTSIRMMIMIITYLFYEGFTINHTATCNNIQFVYIVAFHLHTFNMCTI